MGATETVDAVNLPVVPTHEEIEIRNAVRGICERVRRPGPPPPDRRSRRVPAGAVGRARRQGLSGRQPAPGLRRRRFGDARASGRRRGVGAGCSLLLIVVSLRRSSATRCARADPSIIARHGTDASSSAKTRRALAARNRGRHDPVRSPSPSPTPAPTRTTSPPPPLATATRSRLRGTKTYISGVEDAQAILVIARKREADGSLGLPLLMLVDTDAPRAREAVHPGCGQGLGQAVDAVLRRCRGARGPSRRRVRDRGAQGRVRRAQPRADHGRRGRQRRRPPRAAPGGRLRERAQGLGRHPDRRPPGAVAPAGAGEDRAGAGAPDDAEGRRALRRRRARGRAREHGEVRGRRGLDPLRRPGDPDPRRQRLRARVRADRHVLGRAPHPNRPGLARDDPELRGRALAGPPALVLEPNHRSAATARGTSAPPGSRRAQARGRGARPPWRPARSRRSPRAECRWR